MKIKKRHILLASLVFALSAAVYLNWQLSDGVNPAATTPSKELGAATYVNSNISTTDEQVSNVITVEENLTKEQKEYFATSRNDRQKTQDEVIQLAREVLEISDSSDEAKEEAVEQLAKIEEILLSQNRIETVLKAKGFSDCICCLSDISCTIIVPENEMGENSIIIIKDCVDEAVDLPFENFSIVEV